MVERSGSQSRSLSVVLIVDTASCEVWYRRIVNTSRLSSEVAFLGMWQFITYLSHIFTYLYISTSLTVFALLHIALLHLTLHRHNSRLFPNRSHGKALAAGSCHFPFPETRASGAMAYRCGCVLPRFGPWSKDWKFDLDSS